MCYSALTEAALRHLERLGALDKEAFAELFRNRQRRGGITVPFALERSFDNPTEPWEREVKLSINAWRAQQAPKWQAELVKQHARLAAAEDALAVKPTKKAVEDKRIAAGKIAQLSEWLGNLHRSEPGEEDGRIFPFWHTPVLVMRDGKRVVTPMRYHCRQAGKPIAYDKKYPGLYNARRDNLERFWRGQFGHNHAILVAHGFYENVKRHDMENRELREGEKPENVVLHFLPQPPRPMYFACLWDRWKAKDEPDLMSFAAITDEPPAEVAAAGHDRCVVPIAEANIDAWLTPEGRSNEELYALLDARERPYYEHRLAA